jgi:hypothetical protein
VRIESINDSVRRPPEVVMWELDSGIKGESKV